MEVIGLFDRALESCRGKFDDLIPERIEKSVLRAGILSSYGLTLGYALAAFVIAIKLNNLALFMVSVLAIPAGAVALYVARKMIDSIGRLIRSTPTEMASTEFLDILSLLGMLFAAAMPVLGLYAAIEAGDLRFLYVGLFLFLVSAYGCLLVLKPAAIGITVVAGANAGMEAVGLYFLFLKLWSKFTPILFGAGMVVALLFFADAVLHALMNGNDPASGVMLLLVPTLGNGVVVSIACAAFLAMLPLFNYLVFVGLSLVCDLFRAILVTGSVAAAVQRVQEQERRDSPEPKPEPEQTPKQNGFRRMLTEHPVQDPAPAA